MEVKLGNRPMVFPGPKLKQLEPCNHLLGNKQALQKELDEKGYIFLNNFHDRDAVLNARKAVLHYLKEQGQQILDTLHYDLDEGFLNPRCGLGCIPFMEGRNSLTHCDAMKRVIEGNHVFSFFEELFGGEAITFDFKWLRAMHRSGYTGAHIDRVYMSRGSQSLLTMWTPLGDITADMGVLAVCERSHVESGFKQFQATYGNCDIEAENVSGTGWFTEDPDDISKMGGVWRTENFKAGDVIIFNIRLAHMSTANLTNQARLSCDTRWQPKAHKADPRFMGSFANVKPKFGVHAYNNPNEKSKAPKTMETMKKEWGFEI
ncbi:unnamed protein product [Clavelina lepadiformis]|uniref:Phytanoyl-CoA dioxygenase n=1 Tax=Clavelina lepadiformis TaxID=159417 RepID=A0ABP0EX89_CLALP